MCVAKGDVLEPLSCWIRVHNVSLILESSGWFWSRTERGRCNKARRLFAY